MSEAIKKIKLDSPVKGSKSKQPGSFALVLDSEGMILDCGNEGEERLGYRRQELVQHHVLELLPQLLFMEPVKKGCINPQLDYLCSAGYPFEVRKRDGASFRGELKFVRLNRGTTIRLMIRPCGAVDSQARI